MGGIVGVINLLTIMTSNSITVPDNLTLQWTAMLSLEISDMVKRHFVANQTCRFEQKHKPS